MILPTTEGGSRIKGNDKWNSFVLADKLFRYCILLFVLFPPNWEYPSFFLNLPKAGFQSTVLQGLQEGTLQGVFYFRAERAQPYPRPGGSELSDPRRLQIFGLVHGCHLLIL